MTDHIAQGKYWDRAWSLVDGCTPCSPGCDNCWSMAMNKRFHKWPERVTIRPDRLNIPLKVRKPTVWAIWNDLFHEDVPSHSVQAAYTTMALARKHTFLVLTKRPARMASILTGWDKTGLTLREGFRGGKIPNIWHGLTVCNQQEADEKIPIFLQVPGKKFLSIEPMLGPIKNIKLCTDNCDKGFSPPNTIGPCCDCTQDIDAVILGGETGPKARPMHLDWVRSVRDQCQAAEVPFFFKQWGEWEPIAPVFGDLSDTEEDRAAKEFGHREIIDCCGTIWPPMMHYQPPPGSFVVERVGSKRAGRLLDGREHNDLPWRAL